MARASRNRILAAFRRPERKAIEAGQLLAIAAHDLRNPVSGIMSASEYLMEDAAGLLESEHLAVLQSIELSSRQMLALIDDITEIAGIESGKLRIEAQSKELRPMLQAALAQNRTAADLKKIRLELDLDAGIPPVEADPIRMDRVLDRLVSMSIVSAPEGARVRIHVSSGHENVVIAVRTGTPSLREAGGTLSMLLIERVVEAHGGRLESGNEAERGQVIRITLPHAARSRSRRARN